MDPQKHSWNGLFGRCTRMKGAFIVLVFCLLVFPPPGYSVAAEETEEFMLEDILVTATKTGEINLQDTPISITAFSDESLGNSKAYRLSDLGKFVPNAQFEVWGPGFLIGYIRGVGSQSLFFGGEANVGFYLDGVYLERGYGGNANFVDVERIEVLRGPQGTLYGRNTTGGAVNIITKMPSDELEAQLGVEVGSYSKIKIDGTLSFPIVKDKMKLRVSFSDSRHDGYLENLIGADLMEEDYTGLRSTLQIMPTDRVDIVLRADYFSTDCRGGNNKTFLNGGFLDFFATMAGIPRSLSEPDDFWTVAQNRDNLDDQESWGLSATAEFELSPELFLRSITAYREYDQHLFQDLDGMPLELMWADNAWGYDLFSQELQLDGSWDRLKWLIGFFYTDVSHNTPPGSNLWGIYPVPQPYIEWQRAQIDTEAWAVFANVTYAVTDRLAVEAGLRYSDETKYVDYYESWYNFKGFLPDNSIYGVEDTWSDVTPRFGLNYRITDEALLFATVSKGFKSGTIGVWNPPDKQGVEPETLWSYEAGFKTDWLDKRLRLNGALFYYDYTDLQVQQLIVSGDTWLQNAAEAELKGAELEFLARPLPPLTLNGSISYLDTEYVDYLSSSQMGPVDVSGNRLPFAPEWKLVFGAQYVIQVGDSGFLTLRGDLTWTDDQFFDQFEAPTAGQESYTVVTGLVRFETKGGHWSFELFGKNLGDEEYITSVLALGPDVLGYVGEPMTYGFQVIYNY